MIKYVIQGKKNPLKKTEIKYYPQMAPSTPMTLAQIVKRVEKRSTVSSADVKAVLDALQYEVIEALENGNSVRLGDLGSFRLTMKSQGVETVAEAKKKGAQLIKKVNVQFTKSTTMRDTLTPQLLDFSIQEDIINASDSNSGGNPGGGSGGGSEHP
ncbi:HU family DNA-binding protein [Prevotella intermedia]|uniref:Viral histone-like protein n=1 Tax=Prevotella intermedia TaxID=28131 RepID=A0A2G9IH94_PREIN|nr:HU family DNA-binding protein [Prevotella intermedia]PIN29131.1 DNA-binding protein [Prevotella intermedia]